MLLWPMISPNAGTAHAFPFVVGVVGSISWAVYMGVWILDNDRKKALLVLVVMFLFLFR